MAVPEIAPKLLPVVKLERRLPDGQIDRRIVNQTDYARDIAGYTRKGWKVVGMKRGNVPDWEVEKAAQASDTDKFRRTDPQEQHKRGDARRAFEDRAISVNMTPKLPETAEEPPKADDKPGIDPNWSSLPWFKRRAYVEQITGARPENAAHAKELMAPYT